MKKVVIVDDESAGRKLIKEYLSDYASYFLVGEANNGIDAVKIINEFKPDLVFLDIQMPGLDGFEVLEYLENIPQIIFSTAFDSYALKAFEVHAVDYLLKPYTEERFKVALSKIEFNFDKMQLVVENLKANSANYPNKILVQTSKKLVTIATKDIYRIEAFGDYSKIFTKDQSFLSNFGISVIETKLNPEIFLRVHRSSIININYVKEANKNLTAYDIILINDDTVRVSRGYLHVLKRLML